MVVGEIASDVDLLVIGAGPGGYAAALNAARHGRKVTLIEKEALGGTCLNVGCIPSKTLIEVSNVAAISNRVSDWGLQVSTSVNMSEVRSHLSQTVTSLTDGIRNLLDRAGVEVIKGAAYFTKPNRVIVENEGKAEHFEFRHAIVATGSRPVELPDLPFDGQQIVGSEDLLFRDEIPQQLVLVGGGYIGVEIGCAYAKLGSQVTIVETESRILPTFDEKIGRVITRGLRSLGIGICCNHTALTFQEGALLVDGPDGETLLPADLVGVVVGRRPNSDLVGIENAGATVEDNGLVRVDSSRRATQNVFAIGDLTAGPALAHKATAEAEVAADTACEITNSFDPTCIPMIVFSDPQILEVGINEEKAKSEGIETSSFRFPLTASGRAKSLDDDDGFVKIIADKEETVIGIQAVGGHVAELAGEAALAIETALALEEIAGTIHAHPTLGETIFEAALGLMGKPLHVPR